MLVGADLARSWRSVLRQGELGSTFDPKSSGLLVNVGADLFATGPLSRTVVTYPSYVGVSSAPVPSIRTGDGFAVPVNTNGWDITVVSERQTATSIHCIFPYAIDSDYMTSSYLISGSAYVSEGANYWTADFIGSHMPSASRIHILNSAYSGWAPSTLLLLSLATGYVDVEVYDLLPATVYTACICLDFRRVS